MAGWDQTIGGQVVYTDGANGLEIVSDNNDEPVYVDDAGGWLALSLAKIAVAAAFSQDATWAVSATETDPSTAGWSQDATWDALGQSAAPVTVEATFDQAAAGWLAADSELMVGSATWTQDGAWDATAEQTAPAVSADATFDQMAVWEASATAATTEPEPPSPPAGVTIHGARLRETRQPSPPLVLAIGRFGQAAEWNASLTVNDDALVLALI